MSKKIAIIGGGITGLTAAYTLEKETDFEVYLLEADTRLGGKIQTDRTDGFVVEAGPDSIFVAKPGAMELIKDLALEEELVEPTASGFHLLVGEKLFAVPPGLASLTGVSPQIIEHADFLSADGKQRVLDEVNVPKGSGDDESVSSFFSRRFGDEFARLVAEPILAGTHAGDPTRLSMKALYSTYVDREQRDGNLSTPQAGGHSFKGPMFISFKNGMGAVVDRLQYSLKRTHILLGQSIVRMQIEGTSVRIITADNADGILVDHVLFTISSNATAGLLPGMTSTSELLRKIPFASSVIMTAAFPVSSMTKELCGTGFLTPFDKGQTLTGCTWSSRKWPYRAPEDALLVRFFFGGAGRSAITQEEMVAKANGVAQGILGLSAKPTITKFTEWKNGLPQYELGHTELVEHIESDLHGSPFSVTGASYRGVGIPDCIRQGRETARKLAGALS